VTELVLDLARIIALASNSVKATLGTEGALTSGGEQGRYLLLVGLRKIKSFKHFFCLRAVSGEPL